MQKTYHHHPPPKKKYANFIYVVLFQLNILMLLRHNLSPGNGNKGSAISKNVAHKIGKLSNSYRYSYFY